MADLLNLPSIKMTEEETNQYLMQTVIKLNQIIEQFNSEIQEIKGKAGANNGNS